MLCWFIDKLMMDYTWSTYICTSPIAIGMLNRLYTYCYCPQLDDLRLLETITSFINSKVHSENLNYILLCLTKKWSVVFLLSGMCWKNLHLKTECKLLTFRRVTVFSSSGSCAPIKCQYYSLNDIALHSWRLSNQKLTVHKLSNFLSRMISTFTYVITV